MSDEDRSTKDQTQRVYIPKNARAEFQEILLAFMRRGAAALPERYKAYIEPAFSGAGTSIESAMLAIMIRVLHDELETPPAEDRASRDSTSE